MKASIVELRYKMKDILKALERNEEITVLYHGKAKGILVPVRKPNPEPISQQPIFGMLADHQAESVEVTMDKLRGDRYGDI